MFTALLWQRHVHAAELSETWDTLRVCPHILKFIGKVLPIFLFLWFLIEQLIK
jgi:hypothetical protein